MKFLLILILLLFITVNGNANQQEDSLKFLKVGWAHEIQGYDEYVPNEDGIFIRGNRAYAYLEIADFALNQEAEKYRADLAVDVYLRAKNGFLLYRQKDLVDYQQELSSAIENLWFYIWVDIPWWAPRASYLAEVVVRDRVAEQSITYSKEITIE